jgi:adenylate kinase family enzyme
MIIHICGASGSGKTTLGNKLQTKYKRKIYVKDLDDLRQEFIIANYDTSKKYSFSETKYQKYIDSFISKHSNKPLIIVGLNDNHFGKSKSMYYNLHADHRYYIDITDEEIIEQKQERFFTKRVPHIWNDKEMKHNLKHDNALFIKDFIGEFIGECGIDATTELNKKWKDSYIKQGYEFMTRENIYKKCIKILNPLVVT